MNFCSDCFQNEGLKFFIVSENVVDKCASCGTQDKRVSNWPSILNYVQKYINKIYKEGSSENPGNFRINDVLESMGFRAHTNIKTKLMKELENKTYFRLQDIDVQNLSLPSLWHKLKDIIKYESRFFSTDYQVHKNVKYKITFDKLDKSMIEFNNLIVKVYNPGTIFYRARANLKNILECNSNHLGAPPKDDAVFSTRISPAGIPFFYSSLDKMTALNEIKGKAKNYILGKWFLGTETPCRIIDLSRVQLKPYYDNSDLPDCFSERSINERNFILFIKELGKDFSKPIQKKKQYNNIDYIPTQVITEYFKLQYQDIHGIQYKSSVPNGGYNIGLFVDRFHFLNKKDPTLNGKPCLSLETCDNYSIEEIF